MYDQVEKKRAAAENRAKQRKMGLIADKSGYVEVSLLDNVMDFLAVRYDVAVALLRLSNNNIDTAADLWQQCGRQDGVVIERARQLSSWRYAITSSTCRFSFVAPLDWHKRSADFSFIWLCACC